jgi:hypothetical protein
MKNTFGMKPCAQILESLLNEHQSRKLTNKVGHRLAEVRGFCKSLRQLYLADPKFTKRTLLLLKQDCLDRWQQSVEDAGNVPEKVVTFLNNLISAEFGDLEWELGIREGRRDPSKYQERI